MDLTRTIISANSCCTPNDFYLDSTTVVEVELQPGRMPFHLGQPHLGLTTFGAGVVVTVSYEWMVWARRVVRGLTRDEIFSMPCFRCPV
ncbi:MAG: hypothetical protein ACI906_002846 [Candidatus Latescibacterota bacterium]|jgi:hypothetical protein